MRGFSKAIITGNLTRDPELRTTQGGSSVCSFAVAVNRTYKDSNGEQRESVSYIDCSAWARTGEVINQYAKKGTAVLVSGRLDQHSWEDKNGTKRSRVEIVVEDFNFLGSGASREDSNFNPGGYTTSVASSATSAAPAPAPESAPGSEVPDEIPEGDIDLSEIPF